MVRLQVKDDYGTMVLRVPRLRLQEVRDYYSLQMCEVRVVREKKSGKKPQR